jgi:hypothetical protein
MNTGSRAGGLAGSTGAAIRIALAAIRRRRPDAAHDTTNR